MVSEYKDNTFFNRAPAAGNLLVHSASRTYGVYRRCNSPRSAKEILERLDITNQTNNRQRYIEEVSETDDSG